MPLLVRLLLTALIVCSCAPMPAQKHGVPTAPAESAVLTALRERQTTVSSFAARGEIVIQTKGKEYRGRYTMAAILPDYFLVQVSTPANAPVLSIGLHGRVATAVDFTKGIYTRSKVVEGTFPIFENLWLATDYFTRFPVGNFPSLTSPRITERSAPKDRETVITMNERGLGNTLATLVSTSSPPFLIKDMKLERLGSEDYSVKYREYKQMEGGIYVPFYIAIDMSSKNMEILIRHRDMILNPELYPYQFLLQPPPYFQDVSRKP